MAALRIQSQGRMTSIRRRGRMLMSKPRCPRVFSIGSLTAKPWRSTRARAGRYSSRRHCWPWGGVSEYPSLQNRVIEDLQGQSLRIWQTQAGCKTVATGSSSTTWENEELPRHWSVRHGRQKFRAQHNGSSCWRWRRCGRRTRCSGRGTTCGDAAAEAAADAESVEAAVAAEVEVVAA